MKLSWIWDLVYSSVRVICNMYTIVYDTSFWYYLKLFLNAVVCFQTILINDWCFSVYVVLLVCYVTIKLSSSVDFLYIWVGRYNYFFLFLFFFPVFCLSQWCNTIIGGFIFRFGILIFVGFVLISFLVSFSVSFLCSSPFPSTSNPKVRHL